MGKERKEGDGKGRRGWVPLGTGMADRDFGGFWGRDFGVLGKGFERVLGKGFERATLLYQQVWGRHARPFVRMVYREAVSACVGWSLGRVR
ncbi:hypothetical protein Hamer_G015516 [Homarus americanus]|uniref:Uncharacterized protein n=1 Tax=Homarus americanus TaxID=6706 RepID=A0A8J5NC48_HOMAM|nr:hypothetical protein Hamer_G015516 [Homarus americanus]